MSKNKLTKFAELDALPNVFQYPYRELRSRGFTFPYKQKWGDDIFGNEHPIIVELGCGRGEYTVELAQRHPENNYIGVDIKGNRMWSGATRAHENQMTNVRFLRTEIELLPYFFGPEEISEIWLTFPDPQMRKTGKRLTSSGFLSMYQPLLKDPKLLHLKSDSLFLYTYTKLLAEANGVKILADYSDVHSEALPDSDLRTIETYYESQWRGRGISIKYLKLSLSYMREQLMEVEEDIPWDTYRSYGRNQRSLVNSRR